ncbi:inner centromere protein isoform X2 [Boleophthalmus pectinirostris]|uniref:inner centromere protein isoform X2 n=1 Tax=Boleophthalmus pectinirostris TaxID=150288 RepID=UPI002431CC74|nr:inner centromere protein isoform X2 [Boleophthalmus pectinirostris]
MAVTMNSVVSPVQSLMQMFEGKAQAFINEIDNVHIVWLEEIQQEANRMFTRDFNAEPELMPKTPSQKKNTRRKRVSLGRQEDGQARRRFSKGRRSNLRGSSSSALNCISEEETASQASTLKTENTRPKRATRKKQTKVDEEEGSQSCHSSPKSEEIVSVKAEVIEILDEDEVQDQKSAGVKEEKPSNTESPKSIPSPALVVSISPAERRSAELAVKAVTSPGHTAAETEVTEQNANNKSRRSSVRHSLKLRHSLAGLRHSMTQESVRRASRRSMLKRKVSRMGNSACGSNVDDSCMDSVDEEAEALATSAPIEHAADSVPEQPEEISEEETACVNETVLPPVNPVGRVTRSVAAHSPKLAPQPLFAVKINTPDKHPVTAEKQTSQSGRRSSIKRKAPDVEESPSKRASPPKKSQSAIRPHMKSFLHTVQKNQMLMMTPTSLGRSTVLKSFIKHTTPLRMDQKTKERYKLEALKKKQEQEIERMKKMEEEKKKKQEELKKKRDERLKRVFEAKVKEEQKEEEKKKKIEQKMAQIDEKRVADEKKKRVALKRQEELELKKKLEEEARKKKLQQEEEKRQQELVAKKKAEEEEKAQKLAEARRALELKREQERERELEKERERLAAIERERLEREKALALQRELERAAREKERRELEEKRKALEEKRKLQEQQLRLAAEEKAAKEKQAAEKQAAAALNVTVDIERSVDKGGGALNQTLDIDRSVMSTPVGKGAGGDRLNVTVDIERSPQSYSITPKGGNKIPSKNPEDYGMDQNSDDSTDDESAPRKPIPSWAEGHNLQIFIKKQYFNPPNLDAFFGKIEPPNLENIFYKNKPRYMKRTSSAVWHSPPVGGK